MTAARRRAKAIVRREWLHDLDVRWAFRLDRIPTYAESVSMCSCGRTSWLMPGAAAEDREAFERENADHDYMHEVTA